MNTGIIKEFLVRLGYQVDSTGERKFVDGTKYVTENVVKLGTAAAAAAVAVTAAVTKMASNLEDLYFMSQRTGASAANIQAFGYAASQMGSSVEGARGSIEGLAKFLRENPGGEGLLGSIGVRTRDVNGALRDTTDIMQDIGKRLRGMPQYRAIAYANVFGIDYKTLVALEKGVDKFGGRYQDMLKRFGLSVEDATEKSHKLMVSWRDMKAQASIIGTIVGTTLIDAFDELRHRWQSLDDSQRENIKTGAKWVAGIVAGLAVVMGGPVVWIAALAAGIVALWDDYQVWKEGGQSLIDWGKWKPGIDAAVAGLKELDKYLGAVSRRREQFENSGAGKATGSAIASVLAMLGNQNAQDAIDQGDFAEWTHQQRADWVERLKRMSPQDRAEWERKHPRLLQLLNGDHPEPDQASAGSSRGIRNNNPGNIRYGAFARSLGATGQDSAGFAIFPDAATGLRAINANLQSYGRKGVVTPHDIAHRWSTTDQDAYTQRLAGLFGGDENKALNMSDPKVINALRNGIILQENGSNPYSAEMLGKGAGAASAGMGSAMSVDQKVTINLHGVDNPKQAADAVVSGMNGANDRLVRNLKPAVS